MSTSGDEQLATVHWEGDSREVLARFPDEVRQNLGFSLYLQRGMTPSVAVRRMESLGAGVYELKERDEKGWYRVIYLSRIEHVIHVLHCFEKQSRKTDKRDLRTAAQRLARVRERIH